MKTVNQIRGYWKFSSSKVTKEDLEKFCSNAWLSDDKYLTLYLRQVSKDQIGLGFVFNPGLVEISKEDFHAYMEQTKDVLYKTFGTSLVGWDISSSFSLIK